MSRVALLCLALVGCSSPFTLATQATDAGVDAFGPDTPWPASRLDGAGPPAHEFGDDDAASLDAADAGILALADDAADAPDAALDWSGCVPEGNCGGSWQRFDCGEAGPPKWGHCTTDNSAHGVCCYDTINQGDQ